MLKRLGLIIGFVYLIVIITGCSSNNKELEALLSENMELRLKLEVLEQKEKELEVLREQLESLKYNPLIIYEELEIYFKDKEYNKALDLIYLLEAMHPKAVETQKAMDMKKTIIQLSKSTTGAYVITDKKAYTEAIKAVRMYTDEAQGITWYQDIASPRDKNINGFYLYYCEKDKNLPWLKLRIQYAGAEELKIHKYIIKADDVAYEIEPAKFAVVKDSTSELVWEWYDASVANEMYSIFKAVADSKRASIDYIGETKVSSRTISSKEKLALKHVIIAYEAAGGIVGK